MFFLISKIRVVLFSYFITISFYFIHPLQIYSFTLKKSLGMTFDTKRISSVLACDLLVVYVKSILSSSMNIHLTKSIKDLTNLPWTKNSYINFILAVYRHARFSKLTMPISWNLTLIFLLPLIMPFYVFECMLYSSL